MTPLRANIVILIFQRRNLGLREDGRRWGPPDHRRSLQILVNLTEGRGSLPPSQARELGPTRLAWSGRCPSRGPGSCALWHHSLPGEPPDLDAEDSWSRPTRHPDPPLSVPFGDSGFPIEQTQEEGSRHPLHWKPRQRCGDKGSI